MEQRVNFVKSFKLWAACNKPGEDLIRPLYEYIYFKDGYAYASNSYVLARVPLSVCSTFEPEDYEKLDGFRIHQSLYRTLLGYDMVKIETGEIVTTDIDGNEQTQLCVTLSGEKKDNRISITLLPPTEKSPDFNSVIGNSGERKPIRSLGVRAKLLSSLSDAIGSPTLKMRFTEANRKVYIEPIDRALEGTGIIGIIMPVHIDEVLPGFEDEE